MNTGVFPSSYLTLLFLVFLMKSLNSSWPLAFLGNSKMRVVYVQWNMGGCWETVDRTVARVASLAVRRKADLAGGGGMWGAAQIVVAVVCISMTHLLFKMMYYCFLKRSWIHNFNLYLFPGKKQCSPKQVWPKGQCEDYAGNGHWLPNDCSYVWYTQQIVGWPRKLYM